MATVRNGISKYGTRIRIIQNSCVEVTLVFNAGKINMEVWWSRRLLVPLSDSTFFLFIKKLFLLFFFFLNCYGPLWNVLFISAWMHSTVCGLLGCFTSPLGCACQFLLRNNRRSYMVSRKCWHS